MNNIISQQNLIYIVIAIIVLIIVICLISSFNSEEVEVVSPITDQSTQSTEQSIEQTTGKTLDDRTSISDMIQNKKAEHEDHVSNIEANAITETSQSIPDEVAQYATVRDSSETIIEGMMNYDSSNLLKYY
tara:strand:- start:975 stop:1367 length:393 start_codon:yes stop_codon:yes gene_type:complete